MPELINIDSHTEEYSAGMWINKKSLYQVDIKINQLPHSATSYYNTISLLEEADEINYHLVNYAGEEVIITYYRNNEIQEITTTIKKISPETKEIILPDRTKIKFVELLGIKDFEK